MSLNDMPAHANAVASTAIIQNTIASSRLCRSMKASIRARGITALEYPQTVSRPIGLDPIGRTAFTRRF